MSPDCKEFTIQPDTLKIKIRQVVDYSFKSDSADDVNSEVYKENDRRG
jgi:hypothetical protein